mmetsp:Transcript_2546/g.2959  ORF Transcript_2546/g.2959 Transcript_2546/m.2959 type:complete len:100 (+) Transcript_2546:854-1153(+)
MPGSGAPCTSTARPGRWRSFPYLADLEGDDAEALWGYLCREWDRENNVHEKEIQDVNSYGTTFLCYKPMSYPTWDFPPPENAWYIRMNVSRRRKRNRKR